MENGKAQNDMEKRLDRAAEAANKLNQALRAVNQNAGKLEQAAGAANRMEKAVCAAGMAGQKAGNQSTGNLDHAANTYKRLDKTVREINQDAGRLDPGAVFNKAAPQIQNAAKAFRQFHNEQKNVSQGFGAVEKFLDSFAGKIKKAAGLSLQEVLSFSDSRAGSLEKLALVNDGRQTAEALQRKVMDTANSSRLSYDLTAGGAAALGQTGAFQTNDEMLGFLELLNKQFAISSTDTAGMESALGAVTAAMRDGILSAGDFNTIWEKAPTIINTLAGSLGISTEELRNMAAEGSVTAQHLKDAMYASADAINRDFEAIPATWEQVKNLMGNSMLTAFGPLLQGMSQAAQWITANWSAVEPVFWGIAAAAAAIVAVMGIWKAVTLLMTLAQMGLNAALFASGIGTIVIAVGLIVYAIARWAQSVGGMHTAWLIFCNAVQSVFDAMKIALISGVYEILNMWDQWVLGMIFIKTAVLNTVGDMKTGALLLLQGLINGAIDQINAFISALNQIPGVSIELIDRVTFGTEASLENEADKQARLQELAADVQETWRQKQARKDAIDQMREQAALDTAARQKEIDAARAEAEQEKADENTAYLSGTGGMTDGAYGMGGTGVKGAGNSSYISDIGSVGEVGRVNSDVNIADEDIRLMKDVAEMRYVQNFVTLTPTVAMDAKISEKVDKEEVLGDIERTLVGQIAAAAEGIFA